MSYHQAKELLSKYKAGQCTDVEMALVEKWLFMFNNEKVDLSDERIEEISKEIWLNLPQSATVAGKVILWPRMAAAAAVLTFIMAAAWFFKNRPAQNISNSNSELVFASPLGKKTTFYLADGSKIILNGGSKLTVIKGFNANKRDVQLDGEGYFKVVHNSKKPFIVHTNQIDIQDIGTEFNIKAYSVDKTTETSLINGAIEITVNDKIKSKVLLAPNEKFVIANNEKAEIAKGENLPKKSFTLRPLAISVASNSLAETDWAQNKLTFDDQAFEDIAAQMERWYGVKVVFTNEAAKTHHFTASFDKEDIDQVLEALKLSGKNFNYRKEGHVITIY